MNEYTFLLQVAKQTDIQFKIPQQLSQNTVREAIGDMFRMVEHLLKHWVITQHHEGVTQFSSILAKVAKVAEKVASCIIEKHINKTIESHRSLTQE